MQEAPVISPKKLIELARPLDAITVTRNEMLYAFNQGDKSVLPIVLVNEDDSHEGPYYIRRPFDREPGWGVSSINYNMSDLLSKAEAMNG
jgi:hypothetical protein